MDVHAFDEAASRVRDGADPAAQAAVLVSAMTLAEKLDCLDGDTDFWTGIVDMSSGGYHRHTWPAAAVPRLGIPGFAFADGPRGCVLDPATAFPVAMARGATFDPDLEERIGEAIGAELRARGATFTGAVCCNLLRHPGWGRAQETYGEDPLHVGEMAAAATRGLQRHVMVSVKHFAANSMENARFTVDVTCDERALHEVYLPHFRRVVDDGVAAVMSAYNSLNGQWCGDSAPLLTGILRDEWGFEGCVITDFVFGLRDPVGSVSAGCDVEMPFRQQRAHALAEAVDDGRLAEAEVDEAVGHVMAMLLRFAPRIGARPDVEVVENPDHLALARRSAAASMVMLSNDGILPLAVEPPGRVVVLGSLAGQVNLGDGGSSNVHPTEVVTLTDGLTALWGEHVSVSDDPAAARDADVCLVVVGYTANDEGEYLGAESFASLSHLFPPVPDAPAEADTGDEPVGADDHAGTDGNDSQGFLPGGDRRSLRLSASDEALIASACDHSDRVVVIVMGGSAVVAPWLERPAAVLGVWYPGCQGGHALADVLSGRSEPGGRLPFAMARSADDLVPFDPDATEVTYGLFHGQWHLDREGTAAHRPFGFGSGYASIALAAAGEEPVIDSAGRGTVAAVATNTSERAGSTVVFVFGGVDESAHERPQRRLVGFVRVQLAAGEMRRVDVPVDLGALDIRDGGDWVTEAGTYVIEVGTDAETIVDRIEVRRPGRRVAASIAAGA